MFLGDYKGALPFIVRGYKGVYPLIAVYRIEFLNWLARRSKDLKEVEVLLVDEARGDMVYPFERG